MKKVALIATGSELVYGSVQDQNNFYISRGLFTTGFRVVLHITVGDVVENLEYAIRTAMDSADIIIITGGLGPTDDDHTLEVLKGIFDLKETIDESGRQRVETFFKSVGRKLIEGDLKMVTVPGDAFLFPNDRGLATGFCIEKERRIIIAMPGVPVEMKYMFEHRVLPFLIKRFPAGYRESLEFRIAMRREAEVNKLVKTMDVDLDIVDWGITTRPGMNVLTFVQKEETPFPTDGIKAEVEKLFGNSLLFYESESVEAELLGLLVTRGYTISTAESCTGGLVAKRLTDVPGSSRAFVGGVVAYSNELKKNLLDVPGDLILEHGAVSMEVAAAMAEGARRRMRSDIAVSITGIAGPDGGTNDKPVGTVCFGFDSPLGKDAFSRLIIGDRERIRMISCQYALDKVRQMLRK